MHTNLRFLIADDQARTRQSLRALLLASFQTGEIIEAENGLEALQSVQDRCPDLIIMDARMDNVDGIEATRRIKTGYPAIKVLVLSLYPQYQAAALAAGADVFLLKDENPDRLLTVIKSLVADA